MRKAIKISLRVMAIVIALLLIAFISASFYIRQHQKQFISFLATETEKGLNGATLHIGDIHLGFKSNFPLIALTIDSIYLRDSLWSRHQHNLLSVNQVYATINFWKLFHGQLDIQRLELDKPDIYFYTDSLGYSNTSIFSKKGRRLRDSTNNQAYPVLDISNARFTIDERAKHKLFDFRIQNLNCNIRKTAGNAALLIDMNLDCQVQALGFNTEKGSFLENKSLQGVFSVVYDREDRQLNFDKIQLNVDQQPFEFTGKFLFAQEGTPFLLSWATRNVSFKKAISLLSTNIQKKLESYDIQGPIDSLRGSLDNSETQYHTPLIHLWLKVADGNLRSPFVAVDRASFTATYNNEAVRFRGHEDSNTVIRFSSFAGNWKNLEFYSDSIVVSNLTRPRIKVQLQSDFGLDSINRFLKGGDLSFARGTGKVNLVYLGSLDKDYDTSRRLMGTVTLADADLYDQSRNFHYTSVNGVVRFSGKDMRIDHLALRAGSSDLTIDGTVKSIFYLINHLNEKYAFDWNITSNRLNLDDFSKYFGKTKPVTEKRNPRSDSSVSASIGKLLSADFNVSLNIHKLIYKKVNADSLQARVVIKKDVLQCRNVRAQHLGFSIDEDHVHKYFAVRMNNLDVDIQRNNNGPLLPLALNLDCVVQAMTFNPQKGSFLQNKTLQGGFKIVFNRDSRELTFDKILLVVDRQPFTFTGKFFFAKPGTPFLLSWNTRNLSFRKAASFLSPNLQQTLEPYNIEDPIDSLTGSMNNSETQYGTPLIHLWLKVGNSNLKSPFVDINDASFTATFNNESIRFRGHEDSNTVIRFSAMEGSWENLRFHADSVVLNDLIHPKIKTHVVSEFKLASVNSLLKENELNFTGGTGRIDLFYHGSFDSHYDSSRHLEGSIRLVNADVHYGPRNLRFAPVNGVIRFTGKDMIIDNLELHSGSSDLTMNGNLKSIFYFINQRNGRYSLDWNITSHRLNLDDFSSFLQPQTKVAVVDQQKSVPRVTVSEFVSQLTSSNYNISLRANQVIYKKFLVDSLKANIILKENLIQFDDVALNHEKGSMVLSGFLQNDITSNAFSLKTQMSNISISSLFYVFDNFGLQSLTNKNINGSLSANVNMEGRLTPGATLIKEGFESSLRFNIKNGQLLNFPPLVQINKKYLKKRNLSDVRFADLHDSIEVRGDTITVHRMEIRSSVLTLFVNGIYNMKSGPDMSIQVPLSNLKANKDSVLVNKGTRRHPGISVRLRVRRGADGKLDISWDPFNKANKEIR